MYTQVQPSLLANALANLDESIALQANTIPSYDPALSFQLAAMYRREADGAKHALTLLQNVIHLLLLHNYNGR